MVAVPPCVVTVSVPGPDVAVAAIASESVSRVPAALTLTIVGATPMLLDVTVVPVVVRFVPVKTTRTLVAPREPDGGVAPVTVGGGGLTVKETLVVVPPGVVTVTVLPPGAAFLVSVRVVLICVPATFTLLALAVTPPPDTATMVPPIVKPVPVRTTGTVGPGRPLLGEMAVNVGACGRSIVNGKVFVAPPGMVTLTVRAPMAAPGAIVKVAITEVWPAAVEVLKLLTVTAPPEMFKADAPARPGPLRVTCTVVPCVPEPGVMAVSEGSTVKFTEPLALVFPLGVARFTVRSVCAALAAMAKLAFTVVSFTGVNPVTLMPPPKPVKPVAPVRSLPVITTGTVVPVYPVGGAINVRIGPVTVKVPGVLATAPG